MTTDPGSAGAGGLVVLLHFTRNAFFLLSAFVLFHVYARGKQLRVGGFWRHRFFFIGVPYLVWTVVYWWVLATPFPTGGSLHDLAFDVVVGTGEYHLYFLLVSMQLYLLFPALLWLVRRTAGHHLVLFGVSLAVELALMALHHWVVWPGGLAALQAHDYVLSPMYQFYFLAGGLAAFHFDRFHAWVVGHPGGVAALVVGTAALHEGSYLAQLATTGSAAVADDPLQPSIVPWSLAVTVGFYALGCAYARARRDGSRRARFVDQASLASFGVYLVHPLFLNVLLGRWLSWGATPVPPAAASALAWIGTLVLSYAFAAVVIRTPLALPLTGRRRLRPASAGASAGAAA
jgi:peptidoglycan/LPS O-acetylase OafA/YrhL